jgi:hypothetical protein
MTPIEQWWSNLLRSGQIPFIKSESDALGDGSICVNKQLLYEIYKREIKDIDSRSKVLWSTKFGEALHSLVPKVENDKIVMSGKHRPESALGTIRQAKEPRSWLYVFPSLQRSRKAFEAKVNNRKLNWDEPNEWEQPAARNDAMLPEQR